MPAFGGVAALTTSAVWSPPERDAKGPCLSMTFAVTAFDDPAVAALAAAQQAELRMRYGGEPEPGVKPTADDVLLAMVARDDQGTPVACGALRALDEDAVELKRMYVVPRARRQGLARALLAGLEEEARARGFTVARLETGVHQLEAINLYVSAGYREIPLFGVYAGATSSRCFERGLEAPGAEAEGDRAASALGLGRDDPAQDRAGSRGVVRPARRLGRGRATARGKSLAGWPRSTGPTAGRHRR